MNASVKLGKIWGIPIGLHTSWFLVFILLTWSLSTGYFPRTYPDLGMPWHLALGLVTSVLFFGSVLAHELGHSFIAIRNRIPVRGITLFIFGGLAQIGREPGSPGVEFRIAIAGPLVSFGLAILLGIIYLVTPSVPYLAAPAEYLFRINFFLAIFNLIPGFPLDGGRVLRAIVWRLTGNYRRATRVASLSGQLVAFGFIGFGFLSIFRGQIVDGAWLIFIGWFLQGAASSAYGQVNFEHNISGVTVEQAMQRDILEIPALTPLSYLVEGQVLSNGKTTFYVTDEGHLRGLLTLQDIVAIPQAKWRFITAEQAMVPLSRLIQVSPEMELLAALKTMEQAKVNQVPVIDREKLVGILSREYVARYLRLRAELGSGLVK